jgi:hypothetical protein
LYALYIVFILISLTAFNAEQSINSRATGIFEYNITLNQDNVKIEHYTCERVDTSEPGKIYVRYNADTHETYAEAWNIKVLKIDCRSIAAEKTPQILGMSYEENENAYKKYFVEEVEVLTVIAKTDNDLALTFEDVPYPSRVTVDGTQLVEKTNYTYSDGNVFGGVAPAGKTTEVKIYFTDTSDVVTADFITNNKDFHHLENRDVEFDASPSDGNINDYLWDLGDGTFRTGKTPTHQYSSEGYFDVILVVRDGNGNVDQVIKQISVFDTDGDNLPDKWEEQYNVDKPNADDDKDGLSNLDEYKYNTDPRDRDTDGDDFTDKEEIDKNKDPNDRTSKPTKAAKKDDDGMFGLGKLAGIDLFIWLLLIIIIIIIIAAAGVSRRKAKAVEKEELEEEEEEAEVAAVEEEEEEEEGYECPECGSPIIEDEPECDQ